MKDQNQHIKDIFGHKLGGFEAPVDPGVWSSIQSSISAGTSATGGAADASGAGGTLSIGAKIAIALAAAGLLTTTVILVTDEEDTPQTESAAELQAVPMESAEIKDEQTIPLPVIDSSSYEEIVQQPTEVATQVVMSLEEEPADIYHSEETTSSSMLRGSPTVVNPPVVVPEEAHEIQEEPSETPEQEVITVISSEFTVWRDPQNPMRFTFTPKMSEADGYSWNLDGELVSNAKNLNYEFTEAGTYIVTLSTSKENTIGLAHEVEIAAYEQPQVVVPNVISPNGDGWNDKLDLEELSVNITAIEKVTIYDMSGKLVFESTADNQKWDGRDRFGEPCSVGNFICVYQAIGIDQKPYVGRETVRIER